MEAIKSPTCHDTASMSRLKMDSLCFKIRSAAPAGWVSDAVTSSSAAWNTIYEK